MENRNLKICDEALKLLKSLANDVNYPSSIKPITDELEKSLADAKRTMGSIPSDL